MKVEEKYDHENLSGLTKKNDSMMLVIDSP